MFEQNMPTDREKNLMYLVETVSDSLGRVLTLGAVVI